MTSRRAAVILAVTDASRASEQSVRAFHAQISDQDQLILVGHAAPVLATDLERILRVPASQEELVPVLWREGLIEADAGYVAFSTTQMLPNANWLERSLETLSVTDAAGVGGCICLSKGLGLIGRAIYLQRYISYGKSPLPDRPSGENALYRRDILDEVRESWADGFWEVEVQRAIEARRAPIIGKELWLTDLGVTVNFQGSSRLASLLRQRISHAERYGAGRSATWRPTRQIVGLLTAPLVPSVLLARAMGHLGATKILSPRWLLAIPPFLMISGAWAAGEAIGIAKSFMTKM